MQLLDGAHLVIGSVHYLRKVCDSRVRCGFSMVHIKYFRRISCVCVHDDVHKVRSILPMIGKCVKIQMWGLDGT